MTWEPQNCTACLCLKAAVHVSMQKPGAVTGSLLEVKPGLAALGNLSTYIFFSPGICNENSHAVPASLVSCNPEWLWCGSTEEKLLKKICTVGLWWVTQNILRGLACFPFKEGQLW